MSDKKRRPNLTDRVLKGLAQMVLFCEGNPPGSNLLIPNPGDAEHKGEQERACAWIKGMLEVRGIDVKQEVVHGATNRAKAREAKRSTDVEGGGTG